MLTRFTALLLAVSVTQGAPVVGGLTGNAPKDELVRGLTLLSELNCTRCHKTDTGLPVRGGGPDLAGINRRISLDHLLRFMADPHATKPGTVMPDVLAHLPEAKRQEAADAIEQFLNLESVRQGKTPPLRKGDPANGEQLYSTVGCSACHGPSGADAGHVPLGMLSDKYNLPSLVNFLKDPLEHRPSGRMPDLQLNHFEAIDLATYLLRNARPWPKLTRKRIPAEIGRNYFTQFGCANCHDRSGKSAKTFRPLKDLRTNRGCLSGEIGTWPHFALSRQQISALKLAIKAHEQTLTPNREIDLRLTQLNCIACHQRGDLGGVSEAMDAHFTGADPNLGNQGRIPPHLTGVGAKLKPDWMRKVLLHGESARPYLHTRMPKFGSTNVEPLIDLFGKVDRLDPPGIHRVKDAKLAKNEGMKLAGSRGGLNCVACHTFRLESAAPIKALDLTTMTDRLQETWFHQYMRNPQRYQPLTIMPSFWPDGKAALTNVLGGDAGQQIDALWQYLSYGRNVRAPAGIVREPLELKAGKEAVMLRRNYSGIGKRGIGVGYPSKVNLAFDAGQMRLAMIWRGDFIEASAAFRGQGSGAVRPLSREVLRFPSGAAFAVLENPRSPWPTNEARQLPDFQLRGYTLDKLRRPTFRYDFKGGQITDRFIDRTDTDGKGYLERTLALEGLPEGTWFRAAVDANLKSVGAKTVSVGKSLRIHFPASPVIRGKELLFDVSGRKELKMEYRW